MSQLFLYVSYVSVSVLIIIQYLGGNLNMHFIRFIRDAHL